MKVRRIFWNLHQVTKKKVIKMSEDFEETMSHEECRSRIYEKYNQPPQDPQICSFDDFGEVISSCVMEKEHERDHIFESPKHFGTDCVFPATEWADIQVDATKIKSDRGGKII